MFEISVAPSRGPYDINRVIILVQNLLIMVEVMLQALVTVIEPAMDENQQVGPSALFEAGPNCLLQIIRDAGCVGDQPAALTRPEIIKQPVGVEFDDMLGFQRLDRGAWS